MSNPTVSEIAAELVWARNFTGADAKAVERALADAFPAEGVEVDTQSEALDRTVLPEKGDLDAGGYAFLWADVLAMDALAAALFGVVQDHTKMVPLLREVFGVWRRLREVRVPLTREQFRVLACIKSGVDTEQGIVGRTGFDGARVARALADLQRMTYKKGQPLVRKGVGGQWTTDF